MNADPMVQHSLWHQRPLRLGMTEPVCPICLNPVQFVLSDALGWRCHLGHRVTNPTYAPIPELACPFPLLHQ